MKSLEKLWSCFLPCWISFLMVVFAWMEEGFGPCSWQVCGHPATVFSYLCVHGLLLLKPVSSFVLVGQHCLLQDFWALWSPGALAFSVYSVSQFWASSEKLRWSRRTWSRGLLIPKLVAEGALLCSCLHFYRMYKWLVSLQNQPTDIPTLGILASLKETCLIKLSFLCWISKLFELVAGISIQARPEPQNKNQINTFFMVNMGK